MHDLDRLPLLLGHPEKIVAAVDGDGPFAGHDALGRLGRRLDLQHLLLGELLEVRPAELARELLRRRHDRAGISGMALHQLARIFRIEQVHEAPRCIRGGDHLAVVGDGAEMGALVAERTVGIDHLGRHVARHVLRDERRQPALALPDDEVRGIGTVGDIDAIDLARHLLADAIEHPLGATALDRDLDRRILRFEGLGHRLGDAEIHRRVVGDLALLRGGIDQGRGNRLRRRRRRDDARARRQQGWEQRASGEKMATAHDHTLKILTYWALISSALSATTAASSRKVLMSADFFMSARSFTCGCAERSAPTSTLSCWASAVIDQE